MVQRNSEISQIWVLAFLSLSCMFEYSPDEKLKIFFSFLSPFIFLLLTSSYHVISTTDQTSRWILLKRRRPSTHGEGFWEPPKLQKTMNFHFWTKDKWDSANHPNFHPWGPFFLIQDSIFKKNIYGGLKDPFCCLFFQQIIRNDFLPSRSLFLNPE